MSFSGGLDRFFSSKRRRTIANYLVMATFMWISGYSAIRSPWLVNIYSSLCVIFPLVGLLMSLSSWGKLTFGKIKGHSLFVFSSLTWMSYLLWWSVFALIIRIFFGDGPRNILALTYEIYQSPVSIASIETSFYPVALFSLWAFFIGVIHYLCGAEPNVSLLARTLHPKGWIGSSIRFGGLITSMATMLFFQLMTVALILSVVQYIQHLFLEVNYIEMPLYFGMVTVLMMGLIIYPPWPKLLRLRQGQGKGFLYPYFLFISSVVITVCVFDFVMKDKHLTMPEHNVLGTLNLFITLPIETRLRYFLWGIGMLSAPVMGSLWARWGRGHTLRTWMLVHSLPGCGVLFLFSQDIAVLDWLFKSILGSRSLWVFAGLSSLTLWLCLIVAKRLTTSAFLFTGFMDTKRVVSYGMGRFGPPLALGAVLMIQMHLMAGWVFIAGMVTTFACLIGWIMFIGLPSALVEVYRYRQSIGDKPLSSVSLSVAS